MVKRRGMRLEVDEPTEWQKRNKRWLAENPMIVALLGAVVFGGLFGLVSSGADSSSELGLGIALGLLAGAGLGWAFAVENREGVQRGTKIAAYSACAVGLVAFAIVKSL